jgi:hypothetical protein
MMTTGNRIFYTATMARLYAEQGNLSRAVMIYRHLLREFPEREDLVQALADAEARLAARDPYDIVERISQWAHLTLKLGRTAKLGRIRRQLQTRASADQPISRIEEKS